MRRTQRIVEDGSPSLSWSPSAIFASGRLWDERSEKSPLLIGQVSCCAVHPIGERDS